jgi:prepilin-type N-terminal cleavage/methylation domain-containing protein
VNARSGFTLVELAIVLVIIGLLVGGVLVGQDLIKAAAIRSTVSDLEKYNAAANTFRGKYNGLPGDLLSARASSFSLATRTGSAGRGDGNGLIQAGAASTVNNVLGHENTLFWNDLVTANLTSFGGTGTDAAAASITTAAGFASFTPASRLRDSTYVHVVVYNGLNQFYVAQLTATDGSGVITSGDGLTTQEADSIDEKADDGVPISGATRAVTALTSSTVTLDTGAAASTTVCVNTTATPDDYNVGGTYGQEINCQLMVRTNF